MAPTVDGPSQLERVRLSTNLRRWNDAILEGFKNGIIPACGSDVLGECRIHSHLAVVTPITVEAATIINLGLNILEVAPDLCQCWCHPRAKEE